jgi:hypothetical protein
MSTSPATKATHMMHTTASFCHLFFIPLVLQNKINERICSVAVTVVTSSVDFYTGGC